MSHKSLVSISLLFFLIFSVSLGGYYTMNRLQKKKANDPHTHFSEAAQAIGNNDPAKLRLVIANHPHVIHDKFTFDVGTLLHIAMTNQPNLNCVAVLIAEGADVNARDIAGRTPLHNACIYGADKNTVKILVESGSDVNAATHNGNMPINLINMDLNDEVRNYLINQGAIIKSPDEEKQDQESQSPPSTKP